MSEFKQVLCDNCYKIIAYMDGSMNVAIVCKKCYDKKKTVYDFPFILFPSIPYKKGGWRAINKEKKRGLIE